MLHRKGYRTALGFGNQGVQGRIGGNGGVVYGGNDISKV